MTAAELGRPARAAILASDIDTSVLATAARGVYPAEARGLSAERLRNHFCAARATTAASSASSPSSPAASSSAATT
jgi:chemotaxis protein methyltransferase CheR